MKSASYERVSSDEQAREGFSLEAQNIKNTSYIRVQEGWEFVGSYIDPGKSGKDLKRPEMQRLLADVEKGIIQAIVVHKLDRLTRNVGDLHLLLSLFEKKEVKLVSITENLDTSSAMGRMFVYMLGIFAQWFRENLSEEVTKGQSIRASKGLRVSPARPYGYDVGENQSMTVNEDEADTVKKIFEWFVFGYNFGEICSALQGTPATKGEVWHPTVIGRILANPTYIGVNHWKRKNDPENKRIFVEDSHPAIIDAETFNAAQEILQARKEHFLSQSSSDFCFSSVVKCGVCGKSFSGRTRNERWTMRDYRCNGKNRDGCRSGHISENKLTALFLDYISNFNFQTEEPQRVLAGRDIAKEKKRLEKHLSDSVNAKKNYARAMGSGKMEFDIFSELMEEENRKSENWQKELDEINEASPAAKKTRKDYIAHLNNLKTKWMDMSERQRKMAISNLFKYIVILRTEGKWRIIGSKMND